MESCIHPNCSCTAYQDSKRSKGTLLQLRLGCQTCGHISSEHRRQTVVDHYIREEVQFGSLRSCDHQIPIIDVPKSPVFGPHDPIHLPWSDTGPEQDCSVWCTCPGFKVANLVRLLQKFHSQPLTEAKSGLVKVTCSFCQHPLQSHQVKGPPVVQPAPTLLSTAQQELDSLNKLTLKSTARLDLPTTNSCVHILTPESPQGEFVLLGVSSTNDLVGWFSSSQASNSQHSSNDTEVSPTQASNDFELKGAKIGVKRKRECLRKSSRLEAKKQSFDVKTGEVLISKELLVKLKLKDLTSNVTLDDCPRQDISAFVEGTKVFMDSLKDQANLKTFASLPENLSNEGCSQLSSLALSKGVLVALTDQTSLAVTILQTGQEVVWLSLPCQCSQQTNYTCLSMVEPDGSIGEVMVAGGTSSGHVSVWRLDLTTVVGNSSVDLTSTLCCMDDTQTQVTTCRWSPNGKTLAVGCLLGEVLLYSVETHQVPLSLLQKVHLCGGSVTSMAWAGNSRMLAVGGSDDFIQVLQCSQPVNPSPVKPSLPTIMDYFQRVNKPKFHHSHTLRGHQSFIADVTFSSTGILISVGWDGQVLFWLPTPLTHAHHTHPHIVDSDPVGGFKVGPSVITSFLPLSVTLVGQGLLVAISNRLDGVSVLYYSS